MSYTLSPNANRWANLVSFAEGTYRGDQGGRQYNIQFGGGRFSDLSRHPDQVIHGGKYSSAAAGAYQFMPGTWSGVMGGAMTPDRQDEAFVRLAQRRGVDVNTAPITRENIARLAPEWASLPTMEGVSYYDQPVKSFETLANFAGVDAPSQARQYESVQTVDANSDAPVGQGPQSPQQSGLSLADLLLIEQVRKERAEANKALDERVAELTKSFKVKSGIEPDEVKPEEVAVATTDPRLLEENERLRAQNNQILQALRRNSEVGKANQGISNALTMARNAFRGGKAVI